MILSFHVQKPLKMAWLIKNLSFNAEVKFHQNSFDKAHHVCQSWKKSHWRSSKEILKHASNKNSHERNEIFRKIHWNGIKLFIFMPLWDFHSEKVLLARWDFFYPLWNVFDVNSCHAFLIRIQFRCNSLWLWFPSFLYATLMWYCYILGFVLLPA